MFLIIIAVFLGAFAIIFSNDIADFVKKMLQVPSLLLLLPLLLVTVLLIYFEPYVLQGLLYMKWGLYYVIYFLSKALPFKHAWSIAAVPVLMFFTLVPVFLIKTLKRRRTIIPFYHAGFLSIMLWLFLLVLFVINIAL